MKEKHIPVSYDALTLLAHMADQAPKKLVPLSGRKSHDEPSQGIQGHTFKGFHFTGEFQGFIFKRCKFRNCTFENIWGFFHYFKKCEFTACTFRNSRFSHGQFGWTELVFYKCYFRNVEIDEGDLDNSIFQDCEINGLKMAEDLFNVEFLDCRIEDSHFAGIVYYAPDTPLEAAARDVMFNDCSVMDTLFVNVDFRNSRFENTSLYFSTFLDCTLTNETIVPGEIKLQPVFATMDFQTMLKSDLTNPVVLQQYFNIHAPDYQARIGELTSKVDYKKLFISYSFKDQAFAKTLNDILRLNGIKTFLWENDAPGGQYLEDIMTRNVYTHDIILFIASENSLKSKACQFELSAGRKKQEETWKNPFFPIHIDQYLFEVQKNQIRPIDRADEYWKNIEELKRINSQDFTRCRKITESNRAAFEEMVIQKIVRQIAP